MAESPLPLAVVDGCDLDEPYRAALKPGELVLDREGRARRLPRYFYEIPSWQTALDIRLSPHFGLWELISVDVREDELLRVYPRYVPCAVALLAAHLQLVREKVGTYVHVSANGGYRSPSHALARHASTHCWATAANIYRIGDDFLDEREKIDSYTAIVRQHLPGVWLRPYGYGVGFADDHLHLDLGFTIVVPHGAPGEANGEQGAEER